MGDTRTMTSLLGIGVLARAGGSDTGTIVGVVVAAVVLLGLVLVRSVFIVVPEYQRAVLFRFGRVLGRARGPGPGSRDPHPHRRSRCQGQPEG
jgi:hypothetical protein